MRRSGLYILFIIVGMRVGAQSTPVDTLPASAGVSIFVDTVWYKKVAARDVERVLAAYPGLLHCDSIVRVGEGYSAYYSLRDGRVDSLSVVSKPAFPPNLSRRWMRILRRRGLGALPVALPDFEVYGQRVFSIDGRRVLVVKAANPHHTSAELVLVPARVDGRWTIQGKAHLVLQNAFNRAETVRWDYVGDVANKFFRYRHSFPYLFGSAWSNRFEALWNKSAEGLVMQLSTVFSFETGVWQWGLGGSLLRQSDSVQSRVRRFVVLSGAYGKYGMEENFDTETEAGFATGAFYVRGEMHWRHWKGGRFSHRLAGFYATDSVWALMRTTDSYLKFLVSQTYFVQGHLLLNDRLYFVQADVSLYGWHRFYAFFAPDSRPERLFLSGLGMENGTKSGRLRIEIGYPYAKSIPIDNEQLMFSVGYVLNW